MAKKKSESSPRERRLPASALATTPVSESERHQIQQLVQMDDSKIDLSDAPEVEAPEKIYRGRFYRPVKQLVSLRIDADVLAWFRGRGVKYQSYMNEVLRREAEGHMGR